MERPVADARERLFRDDGGAALERVARLEDENRRLRAELERLRRSRPDPTPPAASATSLMRGRAVVFGIGVATATTLFGIAIASASGVSTHHPPRRSTRQIPREARPVLAPASTADDPNCREPFWVDANRVKHYKVACIK